MKSQSAAVMEGTPEPEFAKRSSEKISNQFSRIYDGIARRAFDIFEGRGRSPGRELEDWFRTESELLRPVPVNVAESDGEYIVGAEVPGFGDKDYRGHCGTARLGDFRQARNEGKRTDWKNDPLRVARRPNLSSRRSSGNSQEL